MKKKNYYKFEKKKRTKLKIKKIKRKTLKGDQATSLGQVGVDNKKIKEVAKP
jgi:hypothetical protein